ncbi:MAG: AAA family ATPase, partial [candidate division Zixibacteria bacterium]|nr:AAA family ATPase [candidate division Zixibacteria bacterium]
MMRYLSSLLLFAVVFMTSSALASKIHGEVSVTAIIRIARLHHPGTLRNFTWPTDLPDFGRFNLIYGWNGTGKTTISRLFRALETRMAPANCEVVLSINGTDVRGTEFGQATVPVRVFNKDFVSQSVFPTAGEVAPIFVLGEENVEKQKQVERLKKSLATGLSELSTKRQKKITAESTFDRFNIEKARAIKETLRSSGQNPYNNYNKSDFIIRTRRMVSAGDKNISILDDMI